MDTPQQTIELPEPPQACSMQRMVQLRWLIVTWATEHWDDRDKEYYTNSGKRAPKLQYLDGKVWRDVPTVEISEKQLNDKLTP